MKLLNFGKMLFSLFLHASILFIVSDLSTMMNTKGFLINLVLIAEISGSFFDMSEILKVQYDLVMEAMPLIEEEYRDLLVKNGESNNNLVLISDANGMKYGCNLPDGIDPNDEVSEGDGGSDNFQNDLTKVMDIINHLDICYISFKDSWKYIVCPNHQILQEGTGSVTGITETLGSYYRTEEAESFVSQFYVNGSFCEAANDHRRTELR